MSRSTIHWQGQMQLEMKMNPVFKKKKKRKKRERIITSKMLCESELKGQRWLHIMSVFRQNNQIAFRESFGSFLILFHYLQAAPILCLPINHLSATYFPSRDESSRFRSQPVPKLKKNKTKKNKYKDDDLFFHFLFFFFLLSSCRPDKVVSTAVCRLWGTSQVSIEWSQWEETLTLNSTVDFTVIKLIIGWMKGPSASSLAAALW